MQEGRKMAYTHAVIALALAAVAAPAASADLITYRFHAEVTGNFMSSGGFAGAPVGAPVTVWYTVDTAVAPGFSSATNNHYDGVSGVVTAMKAKVGGLSSVATPGVAEHVRVVNDALLSAGPNHYDQFWIEVPGAGSPDFTKAIVILSSIFNGPAAPSDNLYATIDRIVVIPAPGVGAIGCVGIALGAVRRRRRN